MCQLQVTPWGSDTRHVFLKPLKRVRVTKRLTIRRLTLHAMFGGNGDGGDCDGNVEKTVCSKSQQQLRYRGRQYGTRAWRNKYKDESIRFSPSISFPPHRPRIAYYISQVNPTRIPPEFILFNVHGRQDTFNYDKFIKRFILNDVQIVKKSKIL